MRYVDMPRYHRSGKRMPTAYIVDTLNQNDPIGTVFLNNPHQRDIDPRRQALADVILAALNTERN